MADTDYDPEVENKTTKGSSSPWSTSGFSGNSTGSGNSSYSKADPLDPVRRRERSPNSNNTGNSESSSTNNTNRGSEGAGSSAGLVPQVKNSEETGDEGGLASGFDTDTTNSTGRGRARIRITRRRAVVAGIGTTTVVGVLIGFFSLSSGPLEFVHIAQLMEKFHFSAQQDGEDSRLMKIARYIKDPNKPQNARLGLIGNAVADHLETKMADSTGLRPNYDPLTGQFKGYAIDRKSKFFDGVTTDQERIQRVIDTNPTISESNITINPGGDIIVDPTVGKGNSVTRYLSQTGLSRSLLGSAGYSKLSTWLGTRVLTKRAGWTFHPIKALDTNIQSAAIKAGKKGIDKLREQFSSDETTKIQGGSVEKAGGDPKARNTTDSSGHTGPPEAGSTANADGVKGVQANSSEVSLKAKITGGGAALIGVICVMHSIDANVSHLRQEKVALPMMRFAGEMISVGSQVQSGQDISALQLGFYKQYLAGTDSKGNVTSTWNQASSIQAELGQPQSNHDLPKGAQVFNNNKPFSVIEGPLTDGACSILGSTLGQIFSIVTGPISYIVSGAVLNDIVGSLSDWLSGAPISITKGAGATDGNYMNYGARLSANDQYASAGGAPLSSGDESSLKNVQATLDNASFKSKSFAYRILNPDDPQTLASRLMDNYGSNDGVAQSFASMFSHFGNIFAGVFKNFSSLFSGVTHAADKPYDWHGLNKLGFTADDLANPLYDNSFQNGCDVTGGCKQPGGTPIPPSVSQSILGDPNNPTQANKDVVNRVTACFGDAITYDGTTWNIDYGSAPVDIYGDSYAASNCGDRSESWMRVRFWIFDTQTMEGYDCSQSTSDTAATSCQDIGFSQSSSSSSSASSATAASGSSQQLAQQILSNSKISFSGRLVKEDLQDAAAGKPASAGTPISSAILKLIATIGQSHSLDISAIESGGSGHASGSYHYSGDAVDFDMLDGTSITGRNAPALTIIQTATTVLPSGSAFGQSNCGSTPSLPSGFTTFDDTCNHLHVQVARGTP